MTRIRIADLGGVAELDRGEMTRVAGGLLLPPRSSASWWLTMRLAQLGYRRWVTFPGRVGGWAPVQPPSVGGHTYSY
jgi:hypothetical protein